jgi:hypothetical protein
VFIASGLFTILDMRNQHRYISDISTLLQTISFWEEVKVTVTRADGQRTVNGACGNALSSNGYSFYTTVENYQQTRLLDEMVCLEKGVHYFVRVDFNRQQGRDKHANLDSVSDTRYR